MEKRINVVTSFSKTGWETYGRKMVQSAAQFWGPNIHLTAFYHDFELTDPISNPQISYRNLNEVKDMEEFKKEYAEYDGTIGGKSPYTYKLDCIKFCHKVFALTEFAFELCEQSKKPGWLVWLDADTITTKFVTYDTLNKCLPEKASLVYLGRKHYEYSETSFLGFNLNHQAPVDLLGDLRGAYISGEVLNYREWHDGFVFERLLKIYIAHGLKAHDWTGHIDEIKSLHSGVQAFESFPLGEYMIHNKGSRKKPGGGVSPDVNGPERYKQLMQLILHYKPKSIIETGTWNGGRAIQMAIAAFQNTDKVTYTGYDLFEEATKETDTRELNTKAHNSLEAVNNRLQEFADKIKEKDKIFEFTLHKGDTKKTLTKSRADFSFIDGGHSKDTVNHDFKMLRKSPVIVLDDYIMKDPEGKGPPKKFYGVNKIIKKQNRSVILPSKDQIRDGGRTHLAVVLTNKNVSDVPIDIQSVPIVVQPKDCVPKEYIENNVKANTKVIKKWIGRSKPNNEVAIFVSGGTVDWKELKGLIRHEGEDRCKIVCVKHSYPKLLKEGIKPWACVILDPRPVEGTSTHGIKRKDLFKTIDKDTLFLNASMTDPSVTNLIKSKTDNIIGWHAFSEALRDTKAEKQKKAITVKEELGIEAGATMIVGGTCAAMRSIGIMHTLGFRTFHLFGYDCSMPEPNEKEKQTIENEKPKYIQVGIKVNGENRPFWTTGELLAMAQDCEKLFDREDVDMNLNFHGTGTLVSSIWENSTTKQLKHYTEVLDI
tara:strand:- start:82 stop:2376 length:2295 start_codon:yes stop_codon:yes gene_type:complete